MKVFITNFKAAIFAHKVRSGIIVVVFLLLAFFGFRFIAPSTQQPQYQTAQVTRDTLVVSLAESGQIISTGNLSVVTQASGVVKAVLVKNGDTVTQGQSIMEITPDRDTIEAQTQAQVDYNNAADGKLAAQASLEKDRAAVIDASTAVTDMQNNINISYPNPATKQAYTQNDIDAINSALTSARETFTTDEKKYTNEDMAVAVTAQSLQDLSSTVLAPYSGVISDITFAPGMTITGGTQSVTTGTGGSSSTTNSRSSSTIATIQTDGNTTPAATFDLSEVDAPKVQEGQEATITLDAFPGKTFTGKVIGVNHQGVVSSGVVNYPVTIQLDSNYPGIATNMSATANIIVDSKPDVLLVPNAAVQTTNGQSTVRVLKNGQVTSVPVEVGEASDSQTQITSGLSEGDTVVVSILTSQTGSSTGTSPFSRSLFGGGGFGGGGAVRIGGGAGGARGGGAARGN